MTDVINTELKARIVAFLQKYCREDLDRLKQGDHEDTPRLHVSMRELDVMKSLHDDAVKEPETVLDGWFSEIAANYNELADKLCDRDDLDVDIRPPKIPTPDAEMPDAVEVVPTDPTSRVKMDIGEPRGERLSEQPLVAVEGVCQQVSDPTPRPLELVWECANCGTRQIIPTQNHWDVQKLEPGKCETCERQGPFRRVRDDEHCQEYQQLRVQEPPEGAMNASNPREVCVDVLGEDLIDECSPGDRIAVTGVLRPDESDDSILVNTRVEARHIKVESESFEDLEITPEERDRIEQLAARDDLFECIQNTVAPSIHGYGEEKLAIALQMFGGVTRHHYGNRKRGEIHILCIGDPGVGKSQLLESAQELAPRSVHTVGKGASAAGLTASAIKEKIGDSEQWTLQAGELVLGDRGLVAIDELDKMRDEDESALHEALSDGSVSISKADIRASLNARCSALMAANPIDGRFNEHDPYPEQFNLPEALLSRCDLIFPFKDTPDDEHDEMVAEAVLDSVWADGGTQQAVADGSGVEIVDANGVIPTELYQKYVAYARRNHDPGAGEEVRERIKSFYQEIRNLGDDDQVAITPRKLPATVRFAEASARARLSDTVEMEDVQRAIDLIMESLNQTAFEEGEGYNIDRIETGAPSQSQQRIIDTLKDLLLGAESTKLPKGKLVDKAAENGIEKERARKEIEKMMEKGTVYEPSAGIVQLT